MLQREELITATYVPHEWASADSPSSAAIPISRDWGAKQFPGEGCAGA